MMTRSADTGHLDHESLTKYIYPNNNTHDLYNCSECFRIALSIEKKCGLKNVPTFTYRGAFPFARYGYKLVINRAL